MKYLDAGALFSDDRKYRYDLWRVWDRALPRINFVCLNASLADAGKDDPTTRRIVGFARAWGYGEAHILNLFGFITMDPRQLCFPYCDDPVGPHNDSYLKALGPGPVAAWGNWGKLGGRAAEVRLMLKDPVCLGMTQQGEPRHPLYIPGKAIRVKL